MSRLGVIKDIYRLAIDAQASDCEGHEWWAAVAKEVEAVIAAPALGEAAKVIAWWHGDWASISDTPTSAARRLRLAAKRAQQNIAA